MTADLRSSRYNSNVYYQGYYSFDKSNKSKAILEKATKDVNEYQKSMQAYAVNHTEQQQEAKFGKFHGFVPNFVATSAVVITWDKLVPYPYYYNSYGYVSDRYYVTTIKTRLMLCLDTDC